MRSTVLIFLIAFVCGSCGDRKTDPAVDSQPGQATDLDGQSTGWHNWRGPGQMGASAATGLVDSWTVGGENHRWTYDLPGRGTPVIDRDRVYAWGYQGDGQDQQEILVCLSAATGEKIWEVSFTDFISDIIYNRYSIGSPTVDPDTGNIYLMTSPGLFVALDTDGNILWQHSMLEEFGRLTFPNGRTGSAVIDGELVIVRGITAFWGKQGPARDRFYAFDKTSGKLVWASTPGVRPTDSSFSTPVFAERAGKRVFYAGTGCGNIVCVDARTGAPISRFQLLRGGVNSSVVLHKDLVIAIHGKENLDTTEIGRMVAVRMDGMPGPDDKAPLVFGPEAEVWRNKLGIFTSSPVLANSRVYQTTHTGELACVNADTGEILWSKKLSNSQLHASPLHADGKLYVPMKDGTFYILRPSDTGAEELAKVQLEGTCLGAPAVWSGRIFVHTTEKIYCFGKERDTSGVPPAKPQAAVAAGNPVRLRPIPAELMLRPGEEAAMQLQALDADGRVVEQDIAAAASWEKFIPPAAKVKIKLNATPKDGNIIRADDINAPSAGMFKVTGDGLQGTTRGRILPIPPYTADFEGYKLTVPHKQEADVKFAYPPLPWIGARFKWEVRERDGSKVLAKTLDRLLFQRAMTFIGHPHSTNYTMTADVMTDGNRRVMSTVGLVHQRYIIALKGNWQQLEVSSNHDRLKVAVPFEWKANTWFTMKTRVDVDEAGAGVIRAKAWERGTEEPAEWTIEVPHARAHEQGSPGLFGFSPQGQKRVYVDNISVTPN